jgi:hypothetical protein
LTLANEKTTFLEIISTKDDAAKRCFSKNTTDGAPYESPSLTQKLYHFI